MKNNKEEILKKAIQKAIKNGYKFKELDKNWLVMATFALDKKYGWRDLAEIKEVVIYSHHFAKAFWGKKRMIENKCVEDEKGKLRWVRESYKEEWQYHLQQLVLEKEPLKYIEKWI